MAIEKKNFIGGLNSDTEDRLIPNGDYRYALNVRASKSDGANEGSIENTKGNLKVTVTLPSGNNKVIGALDNAKDNTVIYFIYNSLGNHSIYEFDVSTSLITNVLETPFLKFKVNKYINDSFIIGDTLFFNDRDNPPRSINITRAKNNDYPVPFLENFLNVIVNAPGKPPLTEFGNDEETKTNNVRGKLFQVRYKYVYLDNEESAWSPISKVALPVDETQFRPSGYYPLSLNNYINIRFDLGGDYVKRVKIAVREGNTGDFFLAEDFDKTKEDFGLSSPFEWDYKFYNDEVYTFIDNDGNSGMRLFDNVPQEADSMSQIDGNKVAFGSITEGYDPVDIDMDVEVNLAKSEASKPPEIDNILTNQFDNDIGVNKDRYDYPSGTLFGGRIINGQHYQLLGALKQNYRNIFGSVDSTPVVSKSGPLSALGLYPLLGIPTGVGYIGSIFYPGQYSTGTSPVRDRTQWYRNAGSGKLLRSGGSVMNEIILGAPTKKGTRYVLKIKLVYINLGENDLGVPKYFKAQYISEAGDTAMDVAEGLKQSLFDKGVTTEGLVDIKFTGTRNRPAGSYYYGSGGGNVPAGKALLRIFGEAYIPGDKKDPDPTGFAGPWPTSLGPDTGVAHYMTTVINSYADWTLQNTRSLKSGSTHGIGVVYYDEPNRSGLTNVSSSKVLSKERKFTVPFFTDQGLTAGEVPNNTTLTLKINHEPPSWAKRYQIVYTGNQTIEYIPGVSGYKGFVQFQIKSVTNSSVTGAIKASVENLFDFNDNVPEDIELTYSFSKGDRIRFITKPVGSGTTEYLDDYRDVEIISYDSTSKELEFKDPGIVISNDQMVEIYTPKKNVDDFLYYEIGECYDIINGKHLGSEQNQTSSQPAIVNLDDIGDVYLRYRVSPMKSIVESYAYSDYYPSDVWDKGRPNKVDNNITRTKRISTIRFSNNYVPETNINGLSQFDDFDFSEYDQQYGIIQRMYASDKDLIIFQDSKVGKIRIAQTTLYGNDGTSIGTLNSQDNVLSDIVYYTGEFGIGKNPESFAVYGNRLYFTDVNRGVVLRLGGDGLTPISEYGMHNYFNDTFKSIINSNGDYKLFGEYDVRFGEYVLSIQGDVAESSLLGLEGSESIEGVDESIIKATIAFSEIKKRWCTFYSYVPEYMVTNNVGLISFKDGELYLHNENGTYNNFYGEQFSSKLRFLSNMERSSIKVYHSLFTESSHKFSMPQAINQFGQKTSLIIDDFVDDEGVFRSNFLKDENTPNVDLPLIEGDDIRCHSLDIELENNDTEEVKIFNVGIDVTESKLSTR